jgi:hypothetical protein
MYPSPRGMQLFSPVIIVIYDCDYHLNTVNDYIMKVFSSIRQALGQTSTFLWESSMPPEMRWLSSTFDKIRQIICNAVKWPASRYRLIMLYYIFTIQKEKSSVSGENDHTGQVSMKCHPHVLPI